MVVLEGTVSVLVGSGEEERELVSQGPGDLMVELNLFTGQGTGAAGIVREPGSVLAVPAAEFRDLVRRDLRFGDFVFQTLPHKRAVAADDRDGERIPMCQHEGIQGRPQRSMRHVVPRIDR